jgi:hypothetical protein
MSGDTSAEIRHAAVIEDFRALRKNSLRGFVRVRLPSGMILSDVAIHAGSDHKAWAAPPSKPMIDREGHVLRDPEDKVRYVPIIAFAAKGHRDRFSALVVAAVLEAHPEALAVPSGAGEDAA